MSVVAITKDIVADSRGNRAFRNERAIAIAALLLIVALQFPLIWQRSIHWDEFFHYSQIHQFANGTLTQPLQTLHARIFAWAINLPGNGIDHVIAIRFVMFGFEMLAAASIAAIASRFTDKTTGIIAAAAYVGGGFVLQHGFAFRADPMLAGLLTASLYLVLCSKLRAPGIVAGGVMLAAAMMISIKSVLFAPAFAGIAWLRWNEEGRSRDWMLRVVALGIAMIMAFLAMYLFHSQGLSGDSGNSAKGVVSTSANSMFGIGFPYQQYVFKQILLAPLLAVFVILFPGTLLRSSHSLNERIALTGLFLPLLSLLVYRNTLPYYYAFILPPAVAAVSIVIADFRKKFGTLFIAGLFAVTALFVWVKESSEPIKNQRLVLAAAERMFPPTTAYIDFCAFLGRFPKANTFMTSWGIELYKAGHYPSIEHILSKQTVPLVMSNHPMFSTVFRTQANEPDLLPGDTAAMRASYIHFWGPYWIAGKEFLAATPERDIEFLVPGPYTIHGSDLTINGKAFAKGDVVQLERGVHRISAPQGPARLVWGDNITPPAEPAPTGSFWTPF